MSLMVRLKYISIYTFSQRHVYQILTSVNGNFRQENQCHAQKYILYLFTRAHPTNLPPSSLFHLSNISSIYPTPPNPYPAPHLPAPFFTFQHPPPGGGRQVAMSHHYFPFRATYQLFSLPAAINHLYFPFRTTTFDSSGQNYFFKWYIKCLLSVIFKNPAASRNKYIFKSFISVLI